MSLPVGYSRAGMQAVSNEGGEAYGDLSVFIMDHQAALHLLSASEAHNKSGKSCLIDGKCDVAWTTPYCIRNDLDGKVCGCLLHACYTCI